MEQLTLFNKNNAHATKESATTSPPNRLETGDTYLKRLCSELEPLIYMMGGNPGMRFVRCHSNGEGDLPDHAYSVDYNDGRKILRAKKYTLRGHHIYGRKIGNTGRYLTADVWYNPKRAELLTKENDLAHLLHNLSQEEK